MIEQQPPADCILTNLKAVLPDRVQADAALCIAGEKITRIVGNAKVRCGEYDSRIAIVDFGGDYVVPGLIDLHVHGCGGADTMDGSATALAQMAKALLRQGTTAFLATTMTAGVEHLRKVLSVGESWNSTPRQAEFLGFHMEGPCISPKYRGAQFAPQTLDILSSAAAITRQVKIVTLAPELAAAQPYLSLARSAGFLVSAGHSGASFEQMQQAIEAVIRAWVEDHDLTALPPVPEHFDRRGADRKAKELIAAWAGGDRQADASTNPPATTAKTASGEPVPALCAVCRKGLGHA